MTSSTFPFDSHPWEHIPSRIIQVVFKCPSSLVWLWKLPPNEGLLYLAVTSNSQSGRSTPARILNQVFWNHLTVMFNMTELLSKYNFIDETLIKRPTKHRTKTLQRLQHELGIKHIFKELYKKGRGQLWQPIFSGKLLRHRLVHVAGLGGYLCTDALSTFFSESRVKYCRNSNSHCSCLHLKKNK